ncbi:MAG: hypothetical protein GY831_23550, partial [Delftia sp.]|nr:hypothetical protein [Delftia sp.]
SQPALLDDLLKALETALEGDEWPPRRAALAAVAAVAQAMPAHLNQARSPGELESLLVRGTTDADSFTARRMALSALSHLRVVTSRVVPALLAAAQDVGQVQRDAIEAAARFRRVEAEALPALTRELYYPGAATAHTVALLLAELGAGRQALDEQDLRRDVVQALAEALADPSNRREVWLERAEDIELVGWLDETLFGALNRVVG